ncbi:MAG TPA: SRPBCC family protein [Saprospiraceae bacterium]|nr:SRPBCC family protein [Saprospiraceae bacterium]
MKFLKYLLYIVLAFIAIGIILGLVGPKTYDVSRSAIIPSSPEQLWPYLTSFQKSQQWTPWVRIDTTMKVTFTGEEGKVGSKQSWTSKMGNGEQTMKTIEPYTSVESELKFFMPWGVGVSNTSFHLKDTVGGTLVTWNLNGKNDFIGRIMGSVMSMDKNVGKPFEDGLNNLKTLMASLPKEDNANAFQIMPGEYPGGQYLVVRSKVKISALKDFFNKSFGAVMAGAKKCGAEINGVSCGLYYTWEPDKDMTDCAIGVPIAKPVKAPQGLTVLSLPASRMLSIDYIGAYSGLQKVHNALNDYITANKLTMTPPAIEDYIKDPMSEPDSTKWQTRVVYFVK